MATRADNLLQIFVSIYFKLIPYRNECGNKIP